MKHSLTAIFVVASLPAMAAISESVKLDGGQISGAAGINPQVRVFRGIPYAAPPVGDLRWKAPKPVAAWQGVKKADRFLEESNAGQFGTPVPFGFPVFAKFVQ